MKFSTPSLRACALVLALACIPGVARAESDRERALRALFPERTPPAPLAQYDSTAFGHVRKFFRLAYHDTREDLIAQQGHAFPLLYVGPESKLHLYHRGTHTAFHVDTGSWGDQAAVSHAALSMHLVLKRHVGAGALPAPVRARVRELVALSGAARAAVRTTRWAADVRASQERLLDHVIAFGRDVLDRNRVSQAQLAAFIRDVNPDVTRGIEAAASSFIDGFYAATLRVRHRLTTEDWHRLRVVIQTVPAVRSASALTQFFAHALGTPLDAKELLAGESLRILCVEDVPPGEAGARRTLGTAMADETFSVDFFGDPLYMRKDATRLGARVKLAAMRHQLPIP